MRILIFHGYLLSGTGSNVYTARLCEALVRLGHEVHLLSQDRRAGEQPFVDAVGEWEGGRLELRRIREPVRVTVYRPDIGSLLPVYVLDRYEGFEARSFLDTSDAEVERYLAANVAAVRELRALAEPDVALANHLVMGPVILARGLEGSVPYAVKIHGSALEYTVKPAPDRFLGLAREGLAGASAVLVGSAHTARSLWEALGDRRVQSITRLGPPGVDVALFRPLEEEDGLDAGGCLERLRGGLRAEACARAGGARGGDDFARDAAAAAAALERVDPAAGPVVSFVGKLIVSKGVDLLLAAWPLVLQRRPEAHLVVVGFGAYRRGLEELAGALGAAGLERAREIARLGRRLEGGEDGKPLRHLLAFLDGLSGEEAERYRRAATGLEQSVSFTGRLDHADLALLLPASQAVVVPSTFPESFGMIAAEASACAALPVSAGHSGLLEVSNVLAAALPEAARPWLSFALDDRAVPAIAARVLAWLDAPEELRAATRAALVRTVRERFSWEGVARSVIAAARGELDELLAP